MDPISLAIGAVGLGMQIFGGMGQASDAKKAAGISQDEARQEQGINDLKQQQMEIEGRRTQLENVRNNQRARAMGIEASVNQGAQLGSGLQGGLSQINSQSNFNMAGVNSALQVGRGINTFNQAISSDKQQMASVQADSAQNAGLASLGGSLMKAGPTIGAIGQGFGSTVSKGMNLFSPGSLSGGFGST